VVNLNSLGGSHALVAAAVCTGLAHLLFAVLGTFILKRFPTSFAIGFLLGLVLVLANQNLVLGGTFYRYRHGVPATNQAFGSVSYLMFVVLTVFGGLLFQFKKHLVVAPIDAKGFRRSNDASNTEGDHGPATMTKPRTPRERARASLRFRMALLVLSQRLMFQACHVSYKGNDDALPNVYSYIHVA
jgi:hypothetical protein